MMIDTNYKTIMTSILIVPPNDLLRHPIPNRLYHIAKRLSEHYSIYLLTYSSHPLSMKDVQRSLKCAEVVFKPVRVKNLGLYYILNAPLMRESLKKVFSNIDLVIHANIVPSYLTVKLAKQAKIPVIYDYMDHYPYSGAYYFKAKVLQTLASNTALAFVKENLRASDIIVTVSYTFKKLLGLVVPEDKIRVIPNGIDEQLFKPIPREIALKTLEKTLELDLGRHDHILLYYGSIDLWVSFDTMLSILKHVKKIFQKDVLMLLVGKSHNPEALKELLQKARQQNLADSMKILKPVPHELVPSFINASDMVLAPLKREIINAGPALKIIETLACATPIAIPELLEYKIWFGNSPTYYRDPSDLKDKVIEILKKNEEIKQNLLSISAEIREKFSWNRISLEYRHLVESLLRL